MIRFYKHRYIYFIISICLILAGVMAAFINGMQLDIQFKSGLKFSRSCQQSYLSSVALPSPKTGMGSPRKVGLGLTN